MPRLIDKYILNHFFTKALFTLLSFITIFLLVDIVENLDDIIDSKIPRLQIIKYYFYSIPWYSSIGLPMSLLLATVFTMGILHKNNELSAIKASGVSIKRISTTLLIVGLFFSIFSFYYDNLFVVMNLQKRTDIGVKYNLIRTNTNNIKKKNIYLQESANRILSIDRFSFRNQTAHGVTIQKILDGNISSRIDIPLMNWNDNKSIWETKNLYSRTWKKDSLIFNFIEQDTLISLQFTPIELTKSSIKPEEMNYWELKKFVNRLDTFGIKDPKWEVNMHFKSAFACTSFLMILFGISLSVQKPRSNLALGIGISVFIIFIYYAAIIIGRSLGYKGTLPPFLSVWIPNFIFLIAGQYLFRRMPS